MIPYFKIYSVILHFDKCDKNILILLTEIGPKNTSRFNVDFLNFYFSVHELESLFERDSLTLSKFSTRFRDTLNQLNQAPFQNLQTPNFIYYACQMLDTSKTRDLKMKK